MSQSLYAQERIPLTAVPVRLDTSVDPLEADARLTMSGGGETAVPAHLHGSVDPLELSVRLEMSGVGDAAARSRGYDTVFQLAETLWRGVVIPRSTTIAPWPLGPAIKRSLFMLAGVVLSLMAIHQGDVISAAAGTAGAAAWISSVTIGSVLWWGVGRGTPAEAGFMTIPIAAGFLLAGTIAAVVHREPGVLAAVMWGWVAAYGMVGTVRLGRLAAAIALAGLCFLTDQLLPAPWSTVLALCSIGVLFGHSLVVEVLLRRPLVRPRSAAPGLRVATLSLLQAVAQLVMMYGLMVSHDREVILFVVSALSVSLASEPILVLMRRAIAGATRRLTVPVRTFVATATIGALGAAAILLVGPATALIAWRGGWLTYSPATLIAIVIFSAVSVATSLALSAGRQESAVMIALGAALIVWLPLTKAVDPALLTMGFVAVALTRGARSGSHPSMW